MAEGYNHFGMVLYVNLHVMQIQFKLHRPTTIFISKIYSEIKIQAFQNVKYFLL